MDMPREDLRRMQLIQLDLLSELDRVCRKHRIRYVMDGGTMLGAIRHKGFIPWDDDIDVGMLREDYEKFKTIIGDLNPKICYFQDNETDPGYRWGYGKLRRTGTILVREGQEHLKCKTGVFIDIFPFDDIPLSTIGQIMQDFWCFCLRKVLWSEVAKKNSSGLMKILWHVLSWIPTRLVFACIQQMSRKSSNSSPNRVRILMFPAFGKIVRKQRYKLCERYGMQKELFFEVSEYDFEGRRFFGYRNYDTYLRFQYDEYMTLPPVEQRVPHLPVSFYNF